MTYRVHHAADAAGHVHPHRHTPRRAPRRGLTRAATAVLAACSALTAVALGAPAAAAHGVSSDPRGAVTDAPVVADAGHPGVGESAPVVVAPAREDVLTITYQESPDAPAQRQTLRCHPAGGTHAQAQEACAALDAHPDPFAPVAADTLCTRIYGGPQTATVTGLWKGRPVRATFSRSGGCEIARWDALVPALPAVR